MTVSEVGGNVSALGTEGSASSKQSGMVFLQDRRQERYQVEMTPCNAEHQGGPLCFSSKSQDMAPAESVPDLPREGSGSLSTCTQAPRCTDILLFGHLPVRAGKG